MLTPLEPSPNVVSQMSLKGKVAVSKFKKLQLIQL